MAFFSSCGLDLDHLARQACSWLPLPQFLVGVAAGSSRVQDLELIEDQGNSCSTGIGVKGDSSAFFFVCFLYFPACLRAAHIQCQW